MKSIVNVVAVLICLFSIVGCDWSEGKPSSSTDSSHTTTADLAVSDAPPARDSKVCCGGASDVAPAETKPPSNVVTEAAGPGDFGFRDQTGSKSMLCIIATLDGESTSSITPAAFPLRQAALCL